jgi:16S rRNA (cytidine1402-2'-O)-methyltransferase
LSDQYQKTEAPKGEIVLVIAGFDAQALQKDLAGEDAWVHTLEKALKKLSTREASDFVAAKTGLPRKMIYQKALMLKEKS